MVDKIQVWACLFKFIVLHFNRLLTFKAFQLRNKAIPFSNFLVNKKRVIFLLR